MVFVYFYFLTQKSSASLSRSRWSDSTRVSALQANVKSQQAMCFYKSIYTRKCSHHQCNVLFSQYLWNRKEKFLCSRFYSDRLRKTLAFIVNKFHTKIKPGRLYDDYDHDVSLTFRSRICNKIFGLDARLEDIFSSIGMEASKEKKISFLTAYICFIIQMCVQYHYRRNKMSYYKK